MDRTVTLALVTMLVALPLAGCVQDAPTDEAIDVDAGGDDVPLLAPDGRGEFAAFKETNRTEAGLGGEMHDHDYWLGRDRIVIGTIESGLIPLPLTPADGNGKQYTPGTAIADFQPPLPNLVYEGTAQVEVVMNWVRTLEGPVDHPAAHFNFQYLTSKDGFAEWREGGKLAPGQPVVLPVKPDETDMPHATGSLWVFRFYTDEPTAVAFNATITVVRGNEILEWPGHPDFYAEKSKRVAFDADAQTKVYGAAKYWVTGEDTSWNHPDKLISYGTHQLDVFVNISRVEGTQKPTVFYLDVHNATVYPGIGDIDPGQARYYDEGTDGTSYHFVVPVDDGGMDSPYAPSSRWGFRILGEFGESKACQGPAGPAVASSCLEYSIDYHMTILASGRSTTLGVEAPAEDAP